MEKERENYTSSQGTVLRCIVSQRARYESLVPISLRAISLFVVGRPSTLAPEAPGYLGGSNPGTDEDGRDTACGDAGLGSVIIDISAFGHRNTGHVNRGSWDICKGIGCQPLRTSGMRRVY